MQTISQKKGFSLIELMIVVAILGILAAVAVPAFTKFMYNSKSAEFPSMLSLFATQEQVAYARDEVIFDINWGTQRQPCLNDINYPNNTKCPTTVNDFSNSVEFNRISFMPSSNTYGQYGMLSGTALGTTPQTVSDTYLTSMSDIDNDDDGTGIGYAMWSLRLTINANTGDVIVGDKVVKGPPGKFSNPAFTLWRDDF